MKSIRGIFIIGAIVFCLVPITAQARGCQHIYQGQTICGVSTHILYRHHRRHERVQRSRYARHDRGCRVYLGCGCHLARYLGLDNPRHFFDRARNWLRRGERASHGCTDCVVILSRGRHGGHVAQVKGYDAHGNPIGYSWGNRRVGWFTKTYSRHRVLGYRYYNGARFASNE